MITLLRKLHLHAYYASVFLFFALAYPAIRYYSRDPEKYYTQLVRLRRWFTLASLYSVGIRIEVQYEQAIDWSQPYVLCPNHTSILDITALTHLCQQPFSFIGKMELLDNPVTAIFFRTIDIPVDRQSRISSYQAFTRGEELLKKKRALVIFPEGGIADQYPPSLSPFKAGAFKLAQRNQTPILPIIIQNAWEILWDDGKRYGSRPGTIKIQVLAPHNVEHYDKQQYASSEEEIFHKMKIYWDQQNKV